ncbi:MAG: peptidoglycan bridge formation glycyltransferase FemA/FemB family protein [Candidatus Blackburnbacteria bacterium]|nr:peptidoglycan bridge formation glycyltransferase FemA/FemB family protein [Candidatus Blackburnbacteria bacterium]
MIRIMISKDIRQTHEYARYMEILGWKTEKYEVGSIKNRVFIRNIPLIGKIAKIQRPQCVPNKKQLEKLQQNYSLAAIYIEPQEEEQKNPSAFSIAKTCFLPPKTIHINLEQSEEKIFNQMKSKTRYNIRLSQKRRMSIQESSNIDAFIKLWHEGAKKRGNFFSQKKEIQALWDAFEKKAHLLLANNTTLLHRSVVNPLAGILLIKSPTTTYYMYAASTKEGNRLFAPTLLTWEAIKLAKKIGCKIFDFEGIYDKRYPQTKSWKGFTRFKEGFGGNTIEYPKTLVRYYNPLLRILSL